ncbi:MULTISPECIES: thiosulfate oxidation carrier complex protein SoxZ [Undibacterium]|jgi:sulfur-oxidizing protein SoxZ|uniref:Thiosulfate oxidation carrier complex protein SoxZ n=1 Tax=Undibacterium umbellatum TaxID=2762300 RepID=A0ABR6ZC54_9BURK|nr:MULTISPECIES: thiosulfate oxidation carrier complex protein SoxZ [Undibacterium]MBC3909336.1 thiosulfate oxidation carrier complex protein SoxZ [Undibacterium umbellatum]MDP1977272.1 thiosulfate oxidation carrier complex protein SoxZ [Undibacterium sp.]
MGDPMRIRAAVTGDVVEVKVLMRHDMETGQRKDLTGKVVPAHFIKNLQAKWKDKVVLDAQFGPSVSKDPFLSFKFKGGVKGDKVSVTWTDNKGDQRSDEAAIA